jgi:ADP-ribose pyrophosphatase YjhB (NUDIX family)
MEKSSIWVYVPMNRAALIEDMECLGFNFHHAEGSTAVLNLWLRHDIPSKVPLYATHNVGIGAVVINSRNEILCVREIRKNYMPWKTPTGLADIGESIDAAAIREVQEETGINTKFRHVLGFRQTHGGAHGRSDMFIICLLDPEESLDANGNVQIPEPRAQEHEIEIAAWLPFDEYRAMVKGDLNAQGGHPMMMHIVDVMDAGYAINQRMVSSIIPGRQPNAIYYPVHTKTLRFDGKSPRTQVEIKSI